MRIALCHKRLDMGGGTERDFYLTATALRDLGHEVHLFCGECAIEPPANIAVHRVPVAAFGRTARLWSFALRAPGIVRRFNCDVVVGFGRMMHQDVVRCGGGTHKLFLERLGQAGGIKRHLWQNMSLYHRSILALEKRQFAAGAFKRAIAVSELVKRELMDAYGVGEEKIVILYNGVDQERFRPSLRAEWRAGVRSQWGIPADAEVALFVGSGFRRKGLDRLLAGWGSTPLENKFLFVVGDDARLAHYKAVAERRAPGRILFAGRQEAIERFYGAADIVVLPSVQEAFGNVVLEALACGLPVVVSRSVGASELLKGHLAEGILEAPDDPAEVKSILQCAFQNGRCPEIKKEARRTAEAHSWRNHFRQFEACLAEVCRQGSGGSIS